MTAMSQVATAAPFAAAPRHFLDLSDFDRATLRRILDLAVLYKHGGGKPAPLAGRTLALLFEKPSTRTRVSFEVACASLVDT